MSLFFNPINEDSRLQGQTQFTEEWQREFPLINSRELHNKLPSLIGPKIAKVMSGIYKA